MRGFDHPDPQVVVPLELVQGLRERGGQLQVDGVHRVGAVQSEHSDVLKLFKQNRRGHFGVWFQDVPNNKHERISPASTLTRLVASACIMLRRPPARE
jgi:hypothetical protein